MSIATINYSRPAYAFFANKSEQDLRREIYLAAGRAVLGDINPGTPLIVAALHKAVTERAEWSPREWADSVSKVDRIVAMVNDR